MLEKVRIRTGTNEILQFLRIPHPGQGFRQILDLKEPISRDSHRGIVHVISFFLMPQLVPVVRLFSRIRVFACVQPSKGKKIFFRDCNLSQFWQFSNVSKIYSIWNEIRFLEFFTQFSNMFPNFFFPHSNPDSARSQETHNGIICPLILSFTNWTASWTWIPFFSKWAFNPSSRTTRLQVFHHWNRFHFT